MKKVFAVIICACFLLNAQAQHIKDFEPGKIWLDTNGQPINAHGGGILFYNGTYYWYGEYKKGNTWRVDYVTTWEDYRVKAGGVSCYASRDLLNWTFEGVVMQPDTTDTNSPIYTNKVIERPKVIYNKSTKKFVMWMHLDAEDYSAALSGVAISDKPTGPFVFIKAERPNAAMARDMTIFQDDDGCAYHLFSSEDNQTMHVVLLSDDYLSHTKTEQRILIGLAREAPAVFKYNNRYYLISSACTGWSPNAAAYAVADSMMGNWVQKNNPCTGPGADSTYNAQSTFVLPLTGKKNAFIFMADRWNKTDLENSTYIWLPLTIKNNAPVVAWKNSWNLTRTNY